MFKKCLICNQLFRIKPSLYNKRICCSRECSNKHKIISYQGSRNPSWKDAGKKMCRCCKKEFKSYVKNRIYCSWECYRKTRKNYRHSEETKRKMSESHKGKILSEITKQKIHLKRIGKYKGGEAGRWKGGKKKHTDGYILIYQPKHPFCINQKYVLEHRLVAEKILNRYLTKQEKIHHINGIRNDNRPENLYLFYDNKEHTRYHSLKEKPNLISNII